MNGNNKLCVVSTIEGLSWIVLNKQKIILNKIYAYQLIRKSCALCYHFVLVNPLEAYDKFWKHQHSFWIEEGQTLP